MPRPISSRASAASPRTVRAVPTPVMIALLLVSGWCQSPWTIMAASAQHVSASAIRCEFFTLPPEYGRNADDFDSGRACGQVTIAVTHCRSWCREQDSNLHGISPSGF